MLHSVKYISSFFFPAFSDKPCNDMHLSLVADSFISIMLYWFYFMIISGREVSILVISVYALSLVYAASKGLKDKDVLPVGSECMGSEEVLICTEESRPHTWREIEKERDERELVFSSLGIKGSEPHLSTRLLPYIMAMNCNHLADH